MKFYSIKRITKFGVVSFWRNLWLSLATITIITLSLIIASSTVILNALINTSIKTAQDKIDISVYFKQDTRESKIQDIIFELEELPQAQSVVYIPKQEALEKFKQKHQDDILILESLEELDDNPLLATINIKAKEIDYYPAIVDFLNQERFRDYIEKIDYNDNKIVIDKLNTISKSIKKGGFLVGLAFITISVLMIFNTIKLTIHSRGREIEIMKLVGATNWFIRGPFIVEGILFGLISTIITIIILFFTINKISPQVSLFFTDYEETLMGYFLVYFWQILGLTLLMSIALGVVSSLIAMRKHLKV